MADDVQSTNQTTSNEDSMSTMVDAINSLWLEGKVTSIPNFAKHNIFSDFPNLPSNTQVGWFRIPGKSFCISIGLVKNDGKLFRQLAIADSEGRVYTGDKVTLEDTFERLPQLSFIEQSSFTLRNTTRFYGSLKVPKSNNISKKFRNILQSLKNLPSLCLKNKNAAKAANAANESAAINNNNISIVNGDIVMQVSLEDGLHQVASWLCYTIGKHKRYTLESTRVKLPDSLRCNLTYENAIATTFFATFFIPDLNQNLIGFGYSHVLRRLHTEAPLGAIRRSAADIAHARKVGLQVSGLESYYQRVMKEVGALDPTRSLEAVHGAERLHFRQAQQTSAHYLIWDDSLDPSAALKVLRIEGALNRLQAIYQFLQANSLQGGKNFEDNVSLERIAAIDNAMIENPAFNACESFDTPSFANPLQDDSIRPLLHLWNKARKYQQSATFLKQNDAGEWLYRQSLSKLIRSLYMPFRFDADFRSNLNDGNVAIAFTSTGSSLMPTSKYDTLEHKWHKLSNVEKSRMATYYNLRFGIMLATLAFGASEKIQHVSIRLDSIGLEEMVAAQDNAISTLLNRTIQALDNMNVNNAPSKGDPKDGDVHGDPSQIQDLQHLPLAEVVEGAQSLVDSKTESKADSNSNPLAAFSEPPEIRTLMTVTFEREKFIKHIRAHGLQNPMEIYKQSNATMSMREDYTLGSVEASFDMHDTCFAPRGAQEEPEFSDTIFNEEQEEILGTSHAQGLSIQREDLLQQAVTDFHHIASQPIQTTAEKAREAMNIIEQIADPELSEKADSVTRALIDETDIPELSFKASQNIRNMRIRAQEQLMEGDISTAIEEYEKNIAKFDSMFAVENVVPRYFNSYAERVVYNHIFATPEEHTLLIPDGLFYAHMELADLLSQLNKHEAALKHLNTMVAYAPTYALSHLKLAAELSQKEDWSSVIAACLNALRVSFDKDDAAFAYYRLAYAAWMQDRFALAASAYRMADYLAPGRIEPLQMELEELLSRMRSQCYKAPANMDDVKQNFMNDDIPVWPNIEASHIIGKAAKLTVDEGMFVIARTLCVANIRMTSNEDLEGAVQSQFLRSLNA
ncbi:tetratricopeptide repeat protein [Gardnerella vaginalis]|uniref:tetratricopeptide repeat protein n=1 Tax=Gardnerella vaginalis TaxID=2702 RepID=UPI0035C685D4